MKNWCEAIMAWADQRLGWIQIKGQQYGGQLGKNYWFENKNVVFWGYILAARFMPESFPAKSQRHPLPLSHSLPTYLVLGITTMTWVTMLGCGCGWTMVFSELISQTISSAISWRIVCYKFRENSCCDSSLTTFQFKARGRESYSWNEMEIFYNAVPDRGLKF